MALRLRAKLPGYLERMAERFTPPAIRIWPAPKLVLGLTKAGASAVTELHEDELSLDAVEVENGGLKISVTSHNLNHKRVHLAAGEIALGPFELKRWSPTEVGVEFTLGSETRRAIPGDAVAELGFEE